jgi:dTDP-4-dehydrorhamnose reductase
MKIFVLGHTGMLGRYVSTYLKSQEYNVINLSRSDIGDVGGVTVSQLRAKLFHRGLRKDDVVINCIGMIKQRRDVNDLQFLLVNTIFPRILANACEAEGVEMIHPSTDCVFSGLRGYYDESDVHDATDTYGRSKSLGEPLNCTVIRTSIIGEELQGKLSLIEWVKSNKDKTVNGYTNHIWNGITCLEFAKLCDDIIYKNKFWGGVRHVFTKDPISKDKLVKLISDVFDLNVTVSPMEVPIKCDRSLTTVYEYPIDVPDYLTQLVDLRDYQEILKKIS